LRRPGKTQGQGPALRFPGAGPDRPARPSGERGGLLQPTGPRLRPTSAGPSTASFLSCRGLATSTDDHRKARTSPPGATPARVTRIWVAVPSGSCAVARATESARGVHAVRDHVRVRTPATCRAPTIRALSRTRRAARRHRAQRGEGGSTSGSSLPQKCSGRSWGVTRPAGPRGAPGGRNPRQS
jgi:hypothetical protein